MLNAVKISDDITWPDPRIMPASIRTPWTEMTPRLRALHADDDSAARMAWTIAGWYAIVTAIYIVTSDRALLLLLDDSAAVSRLQTLKGIAFILVTASLLWVLVFRRARSLLQSRRALQSAHQTLEDIMRATPAAIVLCDLDQRVTMWNGAAERLFGWSGREVLGRPDPTVDSEGAADLRQLTRHLLAGRRIEPRIVARQDCTGEATAVLLAASLLRNERGEVSGVLQMMTDTSEQMRIERLEHQRVNYEESHKVMEQAIGVIGHELRTPLTSMQAMCEYLLQDCNTIDDPQAASFIRAINEQTCRLTDMANNMLESARLASGFSRWTWEDVVLADVAREAVEIVRPMCDNSAISFDVNLIPPDAVMRGDQCAVRRLMLNLLTNAIRHTDTGPVRLHIRRVVGGEHDWIEIVVDDTGRGIDPLVMEKLGHAFAVNTGPIDGSLMQGAGLGLAICREIAAAHGGRIRVRSARNQGTTFTVLLRADQEAPASAADAPAPIHRDVA